MGYARLLHFAARIAEELGHPFPGEQSYWSEAGADLAAARLTEADLELCRLEARQSLDRVSQAFFPGAPALPAASGDAVPGQGTSQSSRQSTCPSGLSRQPFTCELTRKV